MPVYDFTIRLPEEEAAVTALEKKLDSYEKELIETPDFWNPDAALSEQELDLYTIEDRARALEIIYKAKMLQSLLDKGKIDAAYIGDELNDYGPTNPDVFVRAFEGVREDVDEAKEVANAAVRHFGKINNMLEKLTEKSKELHSEILS